MTPLRAILLNGFSLLELMVTLVIAFVGLAEDY